MKNNPTATQWEINKACCIHVQDIFRFGIKEAYELACIEYPKERTLLYGAARKDIKRRALDFEKSVISSLSEFGNVRYQVKAGKGRADALLQVNNREIVIEIKDFRSKPISKSQIEQLFYYLEKLDIKEGILVCNSDNKERSKFYKGDKTVIVLSVNDLGVVV